MGKWECIRFPLWSIQRGGRIFFFVLTMMMGIFAPSAVADSAPLRSVMAPLLLHAPELTGDIPGDGTFEKFEHWLMSLGEDYDAIDIDVWFGVVMKDGLEHPNWKYWRKAFDLVKKVNLTRKNKLRINPIFSHHSCGRGVNDKGGVLIPLPPFYLKLLKEKDYLHVSEAGAVSDTNAALFATEHILKILEVFWGSFMEEFAKDNEDGLFHMFTMGVGDAGEARFPSYDVHDVMQGMHLARYPHQGALQASSDYARSLFREAMERKYGSIDALNEAWGTEFASFKQMHTILQTRESKGHHKDPVHKFFADGKHFSQEGIDFFEWYHGTVLQSTYAMMKRATQKFHRPGGAYRARPLSFKVPGVHWDGIERVAQLKAGQISTVGADPKPKENRPLYTREPSSWAVENGMGYEPFFKLIVRLREEFEQSKYVLTFTSGEQDNKNDVVHDHATGSSTHEHSVAGDMVDAVHELAVADNVEVVLENALEHVTPHGYGRLYRRMRHKKMFKGVTLLRIDTVEQSHHARAFLNALGELDACRGDLAMVALTAVEEAGAGSTDSRP